MAGQRRVAFTSGSLSLEGVLHLPDSAGPHAAAIVCHPHPLYGGDMHNNAVTAVCAALPAVGWAALRFNFRGVGGSEGVYGGGSREQEDAGAALSYLAGLAEVDGERLAVVGYSFGAWVGLAAAAGEPRVKALVAISPPVPMFDFGFLVACAQPKLLVFGDRDEYVARDAVEALLGALPEPKARQVFPGVDHFWLAREAPMAQAVAAFLAGNL